MDSRLLKRYEQELSFIREMGAEFSQAYPKIAARLGMEGMEVLDPYVERLLEGFAFLSARVQLELDLQFPAFTQHLLEIVFPHYLAPTPSMTIARLVPDPVKGGMESGFRIARGSTLRTRLRDWEQTPCEFRTTQDVVLWPLGITEAEYFDGRGEVVAQGMEGNPRAKAAIRLRLARSDGKPLNDLSVDSLTLFMTGSDRAPWRLYEQLANTGVGLAGRSTDRRRDWVEMLPGCPITPTGFGPEEAILPTPPQSFDGYRLLQEYFALPNRFFFIRLSGLSRIVKRAQGSEVDLYILLSETFPDLRATLSPSSFDLYCTPAVNLFEKRCDRVHVDGKRTEYEVIPDRTAPMDYEIHSMKKVSGIKIGQDEDIDFRPFYSTDDYTAAGETHAAYYAQRRRMRLRSEKQRLKGARTSYLGSDTFVSLVDRREAPYPAGVEQLSCIALCTNRDLPLLLSFGGGETDFELPEGGPVSAVRAALPPTRPRPSLTTEGDMSWRLVSHLSLNYLSISETDRGSGAAALRELLGLYVPTGDKALMKQIEGLVSVQTRPIVRRISDAVLSTAVRGIEVRVGFEESFFEGSSAYLLGAVLQRFFGKYVSLNSFTETAIHSPERGEFARWRATSGRRMVV